MGGGTRPVTVTRVETLTAKRCGHKRKQGASQSFGGKELLREKLLCQISLPKALVCGVCVNNNGQQRQRSTRGAVAGGFVASLLQWRSLNLNPLPRPVWCLVLGAWQLLSSMVNANTCVFRDAAMVHWLLLMSGAVAVWMPLAHGRQQRYQARLQ